MTINFLEATTANSNNSLMYSIAETIFQFGTMFDLHF